MEELAAHGRARRRTKKRIFIVVIVVAVVLLFVYRLTLTERAHAVVAAIGSRDWHKIWPELQAPVVVVAALITAMVGITTLFDRVRYGPKR